MNMDELGLERKINPPRPSQESDLREWDGLPPRIDHIVSWSLPIW